MQQTAAPEQFTAKVDELPTVLIDEIEAGQTVTRRVQVFFPKPGQHVVDATLPDDPVAADNRRWCVIDFPEGEPVLLVDGSPQQRHAYFLQSVFEPGGRANTGVRPEINTPAFLRDTLPRDAAEVPGDLSAGRAASGRSGRRELGSLCPRRRRFGRVCRDRK